MRVTLQIRVFDRPMTIERDLPGVPRYNDYVELAEDWAGALVQSVTWGADGSVWVNLGLLDRDDSEEAKRSQAELERQGWK